MKQLFFLFYFFETTIIIYEEKLYFIGQKQDVKREQIYMYITQVHNYKEKSLIKWARRRNGLSPI